MRFSSRNVSNMYNIVSVMDSVSGYWNTMENLLNNNCADLVDDVNGYHSGGDCYAFIAVDEQDAIDAIQGRTKTFGLEIEIAGNKRSIARALADVKGYCFTKIEHDGSIYRNHGMDYCPHSDESYCDCYGAEIIFMPFTQAATKDVMKFIEKLVNTLRSYGCVANRTTGLHVHCYGVSNHGLEKIIDFMVDEEKGGGSFFFKQIAGRSSTRYCQANTKQQIDKEHSGMACMDYLGNNTYKLDKEYKLLNFARSNIRNSALNLIALNRPDKGNYLYGCVSLNTGINHFEFRAMNSSIQSDRVINRILTVIWLCKNSERSNKEISWNDFMSSRPVKCLLSNPVVF